MYICLMSSLLDSRIKHFTFDNAALRFPLYPLKTNFREKSSPLLFFLLINNDY